MPTLTILSKPVTSELYIQNVTELVEAIKARSYSFADEMDELGEMKIFLDEHPQEALAEFNLQYAHVQGYLSRLTDIIIRMYREKGEWQRMMHEANTLYRKERQRILASDITIKALRNKELQEANLHEQIPEVVDAKEYIENVIDDLELLIKIAEEKKQDLDRANVNLSRQQKIVEGLAGIGYPIQSNR